jgi:flavin reductase (DIM6/NTAB) family NADH-FMN oxidoreductase RutF
MPHSVVVATSTLPGVDSDSPSQYKGMTISSFTTLTLTPVPIVTFNIRRPSQTLDAVRASGKFCVHILSANKEGASVANVFTKGNGRNGPGDIWKSKEFVVFKGKTLEDPPLLRAKGITKVLRCEILEENGLVEVGDHMLVLAKVVGILQPDPVQGEVMEKGLGYLDREYRAVGEVIKLGDDE